MWLKAHKQIKEWALDGQRFIFLGLVAGSVTATGQEVPGHRRFRLQKLNS